MNGERYYTFRPKPGVRFFALDSNYMDKAQLQWFEKERPIPPVARMDRTCDQGKTVDSGTLMRLADQDEMKMAAAVIGPRAR